MLRKLTAEEFLEESAADLQEYIDAMETALAKYHGAFNVKFYWKGNTLNSVLQYNPDIVTAILEKHNQKALEHA